MLEGAAGTMPSVTFPMEKGFVLPDKMEFAHIVPPEYKDKSYMKDVTDVTSLFKKLDGAQTLIGQRPAGIPADSASDVEWNKYYDAAGRPKESKDYVFSEVVDKEGKKVERNEEFAGKVKTLFHTAGVSAKQSAILQKGYDALITEMQQKQGEDANKQNLDFDKLATSTFGKDSEKVLTTAKQLIDAHKPEGFDEYLTALPNESLIILAGVLNNIQKKYISEDAINQAGTGGGASTETELRAEAMRLMALPEYSDKFHPQHADTAAKVTEIYKRIGALPDK